MLKNFKSLLLGALAIVSVAAYADQETIARKGDVASKYVLKDNGDLFRIVDGNKCQVTNNVKSFKISEHPNDVGVIYYEREGDLYLLRDTESGARPCPKTSKGVLLENVKKYTVVSTTNTTIVNMALSHSGTFRAWDNKSLVLSANRVEDYSHHQKYGVSGAAFSSYVAFAIDKSGYVLKVKGKDPDASKFDEGRKYSNISQFKDLNNIQ